MTYIKRITGSSEMMTKIEEVSELMVEMRKEIISEVTASTVALLKPEFQGMIQAIETRIKVHLDKQTQGMASPEQVVKAIEDEEQRKKDFKLLEGLRKELASIYAEASNHELVEKITDGSVRLNEKGTELYLRMSDVVVKVSKFNGGKSHVKVANSSEYKVFAKENGLPTPRKVEVYMTDGTQRNSVYADLFRGGNVGKYVRFVESRFLSGVEGGV